MSRFPSLIFGILLAVSSLQSAHAESKQDKIRELIQISGASSTLDMMRGPMIQQLRVNLDQALTDLTDDHRQQLIAVIEDEFEATFPEFVNMMVPIFDKTFTEQEINDVVAFYKTPSGKAFAEKQPQMMMQSMQVGQAWGQLFGQRVSERVKAKAKELGYNI